MLTGQINVFIGIFNWMTICKERPFKRQTKPWLSLGWGKCVFRLVGNKTKGTHKSFRFVQGEGSLFFDWRRWGEFTWQLCRDDQGVIEQPDVSVVLREESQSDSREHCNTEHVYDRFIKSIYQDVQEGIYILQVSRALDRCFTNTPHALVKAWEATSRWQPGVQPLSVVVGQRQHSLF